MTCIVGIAHEGQVYIGGDSAGVDGGLGLAVRQDRKVFCNGPFVMGFTTSFRMGQLLAFKLKPPKRHTDDEVMTWMVTEFIDAVRQCLKDGGWASKDKETETGGTFLVGFEGRLFVIDSDYQVGERTQQYDAVGCGSDIALGNLAATVGQAPDDRIKAALVAAESFSGGVRAPFHIELGGKVGGAS